MISEARGWEDSPSGLWSRRDLLMIDDQHTCHARGCEVPVAPKLLMCRRHWFMVPKSIRDRIHEHYVLGQEIRKDPTPQYLLAARAAIKAVAAQEGRS